MGRDQIFNLGWRFFASKVALDAKFLGRLCTDLANILGDL